MEQKKDEGSQSAEYDAKSLEEALELASEDLGVSSQELGYEVVQDSTRSILGFSSPLSWSGTLQSWTTWPVRLSLPYWTRWTSSQQ
jgi:hypothetical protein